MYVYVFGGMEAQAFRYGKDLIPYSGVELAALKFEATKCLHVIGFVEKSEIPSSAPHSA